MQLFHDIRRLAVMILATIVGLLVLTTIRNAAAKEIRTLVRHDSPLQVGTVPVAVRPHTGSVHRHPAGHSSQAWRAHQLSRTTRALPASHPSHRQAT